MKYRVDFEKVLSLLSSPKKLPWEVGDALQGWIEQIEKFGLPAVQRMQRYRDHSLKGERSGERSIRLSYKWRAIYTVAGHENITIVKVEEVTPHDYRKK